MSPFVIPFVIPFKILASSDPLPIGNMKSRNLMQCSELEALAVDTNHLKFVLMINGLSMQGFKIGGIENRGVAHLMHKLKKNLMWNPMVLTSCWTCKSSFGRVL